MPPAYLEMTACPKCAKLMTKANLDKHLRVCLGSVGTLTGTIEGQEGTFEVAVYYDKSQKPVAGLPLAYFIGHARRIA